MYQMTSKVEDIDRSPQLSSLMKSREPKDFRFSSVNFSVDNGKKQILKDCWGTIPAGNVCAIMGPSGSGKSSLLNVLAGRSSSVPSAGINVSNKVFVGGEMVQPVEFRRNIAYVMQDDALMGTATPREALKFSANLRLDAEFTETEVDTLVEEMLTSLGITDCADTMIGNAMIKGISGGQRKRTSVGVEVITNPHILFLDEPTSGLDSYAAYNLVQLLRSIAKTNCTVLCTIHQPSSEVFYLFDMAIFMLEGRILYQGPVENINDHFNKAGYKCPANYNPADYVMFISQTESIEALEASKLFVTDTITDGDNLVTQIDESKSEPKSADEEYALDVKASFYKQSYYLIQREFTEVSRNIGALIGRFGITIFLNLLFGLIFLGSGGKNDADPVNFNTHFGAITFFSISSMFGSATPIMLAFPFERPMFMREYSTGTYSATAYFLAKLSTEMPLNLLQIGCAYCLAYPMMELNGNWILMVLSNWGLGLASGSMAVLLGCAVSDIKTVTELSPLLFVPQLLFAGFFIKTDQIPVFLRWAQYLCSLKYAINLVLCIEFDVDNASCSGEARSNCENVKSTNGIEPNDWPIYLAVLVALFVVFRILAAMLLVQKAKRFY